MVLGFAAPLIVAAGNRLLLAHAEKVARDVAPLWLFLVFASFTVAALRGFPGRRWLAVAALYAGTTLGTAVEVLADPDPARRLLVEVVVMWWLAASAVCTGVLAEEVWRRRRHARRGD